jgi:HD-GYP domain-containing protein (c-di-GMP phosphodiesterase class II)
MQSIVAAEMHLDEKLLAVSAEMDRFEGYGAGHGKRVAAIANALGNAFNLSSHDRFFLQQAAMVHDVGELTMNRDYISAGRILSADERIDMQRHPVIGEQDCAKMGLPRGVQLLVRWHHEWWNGAGYPDGLDTEQIPLAARILRAADTYASLTDNRPFRAALSEQDANRYVVEWAGIEFDPRVAKALLSLQPLSEKTIADPAAHA